MASSLFLDLNTKFSPSLVEIYVEIYGRMRRLQIKIPTRRTTKNMLREMDHRLLPLDAQCRAAEEELGQRVRVDRLLLVRSPSNSRSSDPTYMFAGAAQVHRL